MKTIDEIKEEYAKEQGWSSWAHITGNGYEVSEIMVDEISIRVAREALKNAARRAYMVNKKTEDTSDIIDGFIICKESILDDKNIPEI